LIKDFKAKHGKQVKFIRCDTAGENKILEATCKKKGLGIIFEFTAPGTPQQNGMVERAFATLYGSMRAMMKTAGLTHVQKNELWAECANTATDLNNIVLNNKNTPYQVFFGNDPKLSTTLTFLEKKLLSRKQLKYNPN
jgi:transposase InsO family protein